MTVKRNKYKYWIFWNFDWIPFNKGMHSPVYIYIQTYLYACCLFIFIHYLAKKKEFRTGSLLQWLTCCMFGNNSFNPNTPTHSVRGFLLLKNLCQNTNPCSYSRMKMSRFTRLKMWNSGPVSTRNHFHTWIGVKMNFWTLLKVWICWTLHSGSTLPLWIQDLGQKLMQLLMEMLHDLVKTMPHALFFNECTMLSKLKVVQWNIRVCNVSVGVERIFAKHTTCQKHVNLCNNDPIRFVFQAVYIDYTAI